MYVEGGTVIIEVLLLHMQERRAGLLSHAKPIQVRRNGDSTQILTEIESQKNDLNIGDRALFTRSKLQSSSNIVPPKIPAFDGLSGLGGETGEHVIPISTQSAPRRAIARLEAVILNGKHTIIFKFMTSRSGVIDRR